MSEWFNTKNNNTVIYLFISIGKEDKIVGVENGRLKIKISKPPKENKANNRLIEVLSSKLDVPKSYIKIVSGNKNKIKTICIDKIIDPEILLKG